MEPSQLRGRDTIRTLFLRLGCQLLGAGHWEERLNLRTLLGMEFLELVTNLMCVKLMMGREEVRKMAKKRPS